MGWATKRWGVITRGVLAPLRPLVEDLEQWLNPPRALLGTSGTVTVATATPTLIPLPAVSEKVGDTVVRSGSLVLPKIGLWRFTGVVNHVPAGAGEYRWELGWTPSGGSTTWLRLVSRPTAAVATYGLSEPFTRDVRVANVGTTIDFRLTQNTGANAPAQVTSLSAAWVTE